MGRHRALVRTLLLMPLLGFALSACGGQDDRIRELEERIAQLEDENADLRKQIVPGDPLATRAAAGTSETWNPTPPAEAIPEEPPPLDLVPSATGGQAAAAATPEPAARTAEAPTPAPATTRPDGGTPRVVVYRAVAATGVRNHEPVGASSTFAAGTKVYCFTEVGPAPGTSGGRVIHRWTHEGRVDDETDLRVGADHWRTYSARTITASRKGRWAVEIVDEAGHVLETVSFTVE